MKKFFLAFVCLFGLATASVAQNPTPTKEDIQAQRTVSLEQVATAAKEVGVVEKDIVKLKTVFENLFKKQDQIRADSTLTPEVKKEKLKEANADKDWKVQQILGSKLSAYTEARKRLMAEAASKKQ
jgi:hypothetical protein